MAKKFTFPAGIHLPQQKNGSNENQLLGFPTPEIVHIPMSMHIGSPAKVIVKIGDTVSAGQCIGEASGTFSVPVFASISGEVTAVSEILHPMGHMVPAVEITSNDTYNSLFLSPITSWKDRSPIELVERIHEAGIVGLGGTGFPTHIKLSPPPEKKIEILIINGAESEPTQTSDNCMMIEFAREFITGALISQYILRVKSTVIAIENNKTDAITTVRKAINDMGIDSISVIALESKYPQGGEKQLIQAVTKKQVPSGKQPSDVRCTVLNVSTSLAIYNAIILGIPFYKRIITISGASVQSPGNYMIPFGTTVRDILSTTGTNLDSIKKVILGGSMMGVTLSSIDVPVVKSTGAVLVLETTTPPLQEYNCINCGSCVQSCPIHLIPAHFAKLIRRDKFVECEQKNIMDCIECGACSYVCPSKINLVHYIKLGKNRLAAAKRPLSQNKDRK